MKSTDEEMVTKLDHSPLPRPQPCSHCVKTVAKEKMASEHHSKATKGIHHGEVNLAVLTVWVEGKVHTRLLKCLHPSISKLGCQTH